MSRVVERVSRMSVSCQEDLLEVQEWSEDPPGSPEMVGRPSRISRTGWETLPDVWEWSGHPPGCP